MERSADPSTLAALGQGGQDDRLPFRLVLALLVRCLGWLRPVRAHLFGLFAGFSALAIAFVPVGLLLYDAFWSRVLEGHPLTPPQAALLFMDPAVAVAPAALDEATRRLALTRIFLVGGVFSAVAVPIGMALYYYQVWILQRVNQLLRVRILERLQQLSLRFHSEQRVGDALYRMVQDSAMVTQLVDVLVLAPAGAFGRFAFGAVVVAAMDLRLGLVLLALWPVALALGAFFSRRLRVGFRRAREAQSALTSRIQETLAGIKVIQAYGAEAFEQRRFEAESRQAFECAFQSRTLLAGFGILVFCASGLALAVGSARAALLTGDGAPVSWLGAFGFSVWTLGLYSYLKVRLGDGGGAIRHLMRTWGRTQDIAIGLHRVFELLDLEPEIQDAPDAAPFTGLREGVRFEHVAFRYQPDRPALEDVSFEARVGEVTALVGPTGSGKTTLMALLLRLFDPQRGSVRVDGRDLRTLRIGDLREHVAVALQENLLFGTSVRENIRYAVPDADDAAVREAARVACADEFIERLPEGYDTLLGERGTKLSTGQRQRLTIARAVLKDAPILILDEPTASLDAETELRVLERLAEWGRGRLIFIVTHRLSTIRRADRIVVLQDGRIVESGRHAELFARPGGVYRALFEAELGSAARAARGAAR